MRSKVIITLFGLLAFLRISEASTLEDAAARLEPGESIRLDTTLPGSLLTPDDADFLQWASSGVWDPVRREIRFIGKRDGPSPYRFLVYDENTNAWSNSRKLPGPLSEDNYGHGYDHNTIDPATGAHYFRPYNSYTIYKWDGSWSTLSLPQVGKTIAATTSWVSGVGLVYIDEHQFVRWNGSSWKELGDSPISSYHAVSEYNRASDTLIFGGGNGGRQMWKYRSGSGVSSIASPPFNLGSAYSQGLLTSAPGSEQFIGWEKRTTNWTQYDVSSNSWSQLSVSSGDGSSPQSGVPNLSVGSSVDHAVIGIPIDTYGVIMYIQYAGASVDANVWLYKHSDSVAVARPNAPKTLLAD